MPRPSASPSPSPTPLQDPTPPLSPFFQQPPEDLSPSPSPSLPDPAPDSSSSPGPSLDDRGSASSSYTRSTLGKPEQKPLGRAQLRKVAGAAVTALGGLLANVLTAPESVEREQKLWVPDEQDVQAIGDPLAGIAARRVPAGVAGPDTPDVVALVVGLVGYVGKQFAKRAELRAERARLQAQQDLWPDGGESGEPS